MLLMVILIKIQELIGSLFELYKNMTLQDKIKAINLTIIKKIDLEDDLAILIGKIAL